LGQAADRVHRLIDLSDVGIYVSGADISVKRDSLERRRDAMQRFIRALEEAYRLAKARPDLVRRIYQKYLKPESPVTLEWMVKAYGDAKVPERPLPGRRARASHLAEVMSTQPDVERRRDAMQRFIRALEEAYRLAKARPDLVRRIYQKYLKPESPVTLEWMVKAYGDAKVPERPLPDRRAVASHIAEIMSKQPD